MGAGERCRQAEGVHAAAAMVVDLEVGYIEGVGDGIEAGFYDCDKIGQRRNWEWAPNKFGGSEGGRNNR